MIFSYFNIFWVSIWGFRCFACLRKRLRSRTLLKFALLVFEGLRSRTVGVLLRDFYLCLISSAYCFLLARLDSTCRLLWFVENRWLWDWASLSGLLLRKATGETDCLTFSSRDWEWLLKSIVLSISNAVMLSFTNDLNWSRSVSCSCASCFKSRFWASNWALSACISASFCSRNARSLSTVFRFALTITSLVFSATKSSIRDS